MCYLPHAKHHQACFVFWLIVKVLGSCGVQTVTAGGRLTIKDQVGVASRL